MAGKDSVIIHIDGDDTGYELSLKQIESKTKKSTNKLQSELKAVNGVAVGVATAVGTIGAAVVGLGVKYNAEMEQYKAGFTTMLGSAEQADKTIASLKSFAEKTPFELTDLANASTTLLAFGEDVNNLEADLKMLGDISLGNQEKFKGLALVFGQVQSQGKLMGQDLLQMINQGFNPLQVISEKTGESMASLKDKMSKGQISFEMVADAMRTATSEGGQFFNAMEAQSKTFTGQVSTLKDNVTSLFGEMSADISQSLTEDVLPKAIEMVGDLKEAWEDGSLQKQIKGAAVALTAFGGAVVGVNVAVFANDMIQLVKGTKDFTAATKLGTTAQKLFNAELLKNPYTWVAVALGTLVSGIIAYDAATESAAEKAKKLTEEVEKTAEAYHDASDSINENLASNLAEATSAERLTDKLFKLEEQINSNTLSEEEATKAKSEFTSVANQLNKMMPGLINYIGSETNAFSLQKDKVYELANAYIALMKARAYADAYKEQYQLALTQQITTQKQIDDMTYDDRFDVGIVPTYNEQGTFTGYTDGVIETKAYTTAKNNRAEANKDVAYWDTLWTEAEKNVLSYEASVDSLGGTAGEAAGAVTGAANTAAGNTKKAAKEVTDTLTKEEQAQLQGLKDLYAAGEISAKEYFAELQNFRDENLKKDSEGWNEITDIIDSECRKQFQSVMEAYNNGEISSRRYYLELRKLRDRNFIEESEYWESITKIIEIARDKDIKNIQYAHDIGETSDEEYYKALAEHRDSFFETGSDEWRQYTLEIYNWQKSILGKVRQDATAAVEEFKKAKEEIVAGLNDDIADTYQTVTIQDGEDTYTYTKLADIGAEDKKLEEYEEKLDELFERNGGELPDYILRQLRSMNVDEGLNYVNAMLRASDSEFEAQIKSFEEKSERQGRIADKLLPDEAKRLTESLTEIYGTIPEGFFDIGEDSATEFAEGFGAQLATELKNIMDGAMASFYSTFTPAIMTAGVPGAGTVYNNSYTYNLQSSGESVYAQRKAIDDQNTYNSMIGEG